MIESKDCRECAREIDSTIKKELKSIIDHRSKCRKCIGCHRLQKVNEALQKVKETGKG